MAPPGQVAIPATERHSHSGCDGLSSRLKGFTLIEILVVLVIISIITAVAILSLGSLGGNTATKHAAEQLADLTDLVSQQAVMRGQQYGLLIAPHGYTFLHYNGRDWSPVQDDDLLRARQLESSVTLSLQLEGTPIVLPADNHQADDSDVVTGKQELKPQIMLLSSGEITPFKLTVSGNDQNLPYVITGDLLHGVRLVSPDTHGSS
ncbi:MAG TPA: type II secretion system minor pseudopilin GspH [Gammaproteobacteria bacterium]|nr:type II secretion system minor pseudopilin GspH [Gammaproteobacteria bacterium]